MRSVWPGSKTHGLSTTLGLYHKTRGLSSVLLLITSDEKNGRLEVSGAMKLHRRKYIKRPRSTHGGRAMRPWSHWVFFFIYIISCREQRTLGVLI